MQKEYELWLDESGEFENEKLNSKDLKNFPRGFHPSLIGGWLVPYAACGQDDLSEFVVSNPKDGEYHAAGIAKPEGKRLAFAGMNYVATKLEGKIVLFQNKELFDPGNRELYLRLMAAGLLQLLQELNAGSESIKLHVIIARRYDMTARYPDKYEIGDDEYKNILSKFIFAYKKEGHILLHEDTEMSIAIDSARKDNRLKMADYVCNIELTQGSKKYNKQDIDNYKILKKNSFEYSFTINSTLNAVNMALAQGNIANALVDAVFSGPNENFHKLLDVIIAKLKDMGFRGMKVQLDQCSREFTTYVYMEDDYERSEEFLKKLLNDVIPEFEKNDFPCKKFKFAVEMLLTKMYLREGDIERATEEINKCRETEKLLPSSLESLLTYYQLLEKEALVAIDSFEFEKGAKLMSDACGCFKSLMDCISHVDVLKERFPKVISEYYGDALCMKIYAELFMQRQMPELEKSMTEDSDIALKQYGMYEGELERHRQYRSVIETQKKDFHLAAKWLLMTQNGRITMASLSDGTELTKKDFCMFLSSVIQNEGKTSRRYYLMYYVKIMAEAALEGNDIAEDMFSALTENKGIQEAEDMKDIMGPNDHDTITNESVVKELDKAIRPCPYYDYHPLEVNFWKQATYKWVKHQYNDACELYVKALKICYDYSDYIQLAVIGLGIRAEYIVCLLDKGDENEARSEYNELICRAETIFKRIRISGIKNISQSIYDSAKDAFVYDKLDRDKMWKISRRITF